MPYLFMAVDKIQIALVLNVRRIYWRDVLAYSNHTCLTIMLNA